MLEFLAGRKFELVKLNKTEYYLEIAKVVAQKSTCLRRKYGAVIVKDNDIVATGYNGAPSGRKHCNDIGFCFRESQNIPRGERYELCRSVHAEANAIIHCNREDSKGSVLYLYGEDAKGMIVENSQPCSMCKRMIINAKIKQVVVREPKGKFSSYSVEHWILDEDVLNGIFGY